MDTWATLIGLDPWGPQMAALCALEGLVLGIVILAGFMLFKQSGQRAGKHVARGSSDLGILELWRLGRDLRRQSAYAPTSAVNGATGSLYPPGVARTDPVSEPRAVTSADVGIS